MDFESTEESKLPEPKWVLPDFSSEEERGELDRVCRTFLPNNPEEMEKRFYDRLSDVQVITLTEELLLELDNTDALGVAEGDFEHVDQNIRDGAARDPKNIRDWRDLKEKMERGKELDMPVIVKINNLYHKMSGNTRLMVCRALGIMPQVAIVDLSD